MGQTRLPRPGLSRPRNRGGQSLPIRASTYRRGTFRRLARVLLVLSQGVAAAVKAPDEKRIARAPHRLRGGRASEEWKEYDMSFTQILYEEDGPIGTITLNRPDNGNMFTETMCHEIRDCIEAIRRETRTRVVVLTGAGDKFFCIGGEMTGMQDTTLYAGVLPTLEMYEAIDRLQKPVIASVNGFAVGGGNVLQMVCDVTIAKESAVFRQVGPMMGSFDAGYGTWYLEDLVGKKRAKEMWYANIKIPAKEAKEIGLINRVVSDDQLAEKTREFALEIADRGPIALAAIKGAFNARHGGVAGLSRVTHDILLRQYLETDEHKEMYESFNTRRKPDPSKFGK